MSLTPLNEPLGRTRAAHLLRRACFGASIKEIDAFALLTPSEAFDKLYLTDLPVPQSTANAQIPYPIDPMTGLEWITTGIDDKSNSEPFVLGQLLNAWQIGQMLAPAVASEQKLAYIFRERIMWFFHTHFTTKQSVVNDNQAIFYQNALFRKFAFDKEDDSRPGVIDPAFPDVPVPDEIIPVNFKVLVNKISVDNAMLVFLDGRLNVKGSPNENFARELMELYVIGRGLEGEVPDPEFDGDYFNYTEQDVQEGAKILSGFDRDDTFSNIDIDTNLPRGKVKGTGVVASRHDNGTKTLSQRLGNAVIAPNPDLLQGSSATEESVLDEISQFIDVLFNQDETAIHICRKLYRFFIYHEVNATVQNGIIQDMANIFKANEFKLYPVLQALLTSREYYEGAPGYLDNTFGSIIKSPLDLTLGFIRNFEIPVPDYSDWTAFYAFNNAIKSKIDLQGLSFYEPYEVAGYPAYHQFPIYNRSWITTNYLTRRYQLVSLGFSEGIYKDGPKVEIYTFVKANIDNATAREAKSLVIALSQYFLPVSQTLSFDDPATTELTQQRLNYFVTTFLSDIDADPEAMWTTRWDGASAMEIDTMTGQLQRLMGAMLQSPEYQLM
jgi:hypothetical protein